MPTKIKIIKEEIDLPRGMEKYTEMDPVSLPVFFRKNFDGVVPSGIPDIKVHHYELCRVDSNLGEPAREYLVNIDERRLFQDLIAVSDKLFDKVVQEQIQKVRLEEIPEVVLAAKDGTIKKIKSLPWWKRLFNKF